MQEAIFNTEERIEISSEMVKELEQRAREAPRGRFRLCLHGSHDEAIQEMLIACLRGSYFRPHRNLSNEDKSYSVVLGELAVILFDDEGKILRQVEMGPFDSGKPFLFRFTARQWHMPLPRSDVVVYHEVRTGPFNKESDMIVPTWSLAEDDPAVKDFIEELLA